MYTHFTVQGIQMESILSNKYYIRDFIKNTLLTKQESTVKGAKVSTHFILRFLNSNHRVRFQIVLAQINNASRCVFIGVSASEYTQCNSIQWWESRQIVNKQYERLSAAAALSKSSCRDQQQGTTRSSSLSSYSGLLRQTKLNVIVVMIHDFVAQIIESLRENSKHFVRTMNRYL